MRARAALAVAVLGVVALAPGVPSSAQPGAQPAVQAPLALRDVMFVGNNWAGTASIVDARTHEVLQRGVNLIPDKQEELTRILTDPVALAFYLAIQQGPGEGHDQYVDDMFTTSDGKYLAVSRPSFADVVWIDIEKAVAKAPAGEVVVAEASMDGYRTDHMGLSPDGRRLLASDSTDRKVIEYSMESADIAAAAAAGNGELLRRRTFVSGETPHENNYTKDGSRIFHASIGKVYTPGDDPLLDALKGDRWFQVVRNSDFAVTQRWDMGKELAEAGYPGMSSAVRPMALSPDERFVYFQVSFFHGLVEFDTLAPDSNPLLNYTLGGIPEPRVGAVKRVIQLPNRVPHLLREQYVNDSAHHGLSMDATGKSLCVAGTMDDYAALVDRKTGSHTIFDTATTGHDYAKPYWTTEGLRNTCWISLSESDSVAVLDFATGREVAYLAVGDHPQRVRHGYVPESVVAGWTD